MATGRSWMEGQASGVRDDIDRYSRTSSMVPQYLSLLEDAVGQSSVSSVQRLNNSGLESDRRASAGLARHANSAARKSFIHSRPADAALTPSQRRTSYLSTSVALTESMLWADASRIDMLPMETIMEDNMTMLIDEDPAAAACQGLYADFQAVMKCNEQRPVSQMEQYVSLCAESALHLDTLLKRTPPGQARSVDIDNMVDLLKHETRTWRLLVALYKDRISQHADDIDTDMLNKLNSDKQVVEHLFGTDAVIRQLQIIVDWLETSAAEQIDALFTRAEYFTDKNEAWSETLHLLQTAARFSSGRHFVTELDPDCSVRQRRQLSDGDMDDDARLVKCMFAFVRAGKLSEAQQLCAAVGQPWRATTLEGWRLYHDANVDKANSSLVEGNPHRDIWKAACWRVANEEHVSVYERALYASLCGCLNQLLPVLESWEDHLWAYSRCTVDVLVENSMRESIHITHPFLDLPSDYPKKGFSLDAIFKELLASSSERVRREGLYRYNIIDKHIALNNTHALLTDMHQWCMDKHSPPAAHFVRFMAHVSLFLKAAAGLDGHTATLNETQVNDIVETYVMQLIAHNERDLIASYAVTLPRDRQIKSYAQFLQGVTETEERRRCLELAQEAGLSILDITKVVVETARAVGETDICQDKDLPLTVATTQEDQVKIRALEWLTFDVAQRAEALHQANGMIRLFIGVRKLSAAQDVCRMLPADIINSIIQHAGGKEGLQADDDNAIREHLCLMFYLDAQNSFTAWFDHFHQSKPLRPSEQHGSHFTERVAHEKRLAQYDMELDRWQHNLLTQTKVTVSKMYNVLLFPDGGWLIDQRKDGQRDDKRARQLRLLRQMCLPSLCQLVHNVLHSTHQYRECLQLADIIADDQHQLYKAFHKEELQLLLSKLRESSIALLDKNLDPLGYPLTT